MLYASHAFLAASPTQGQYMLTWQIRLSHMLITTHRNSCTQTGYSVGSSMLCRHSSGAALFPDGVIADQLIGMRDAGAHMELFLSAHAITVQQMYCIVFDRLLSGQLILSAWCIYCEC